MPAVIVDDDDPPRRNAIVEMDQGLARRSVDIGVDAQEGQGPDGGAGQGFREPSREKNHPFVQKPVTQEMVPDAFQAEGHERRRRLGKIAAASDVGFGPGLRQAPERIGGPQAALRLAEGDLQGPQEDRRPPLADPGLQEIAGDSVGENPLGGAFQVVEPREADQRMGEAQGDAGGRAGSEVHLGVEKGAESLRLSKSDIPQKSRFLQLVRERFVGLPAGFPETADPELVFRINQVEEGPFQEMEITRALPLRGGGGGALLRQALSVE